MTNLASSPRWLHRCSVLAVAATLALLALGAVVTTFRVGMADPIWPTYPWHLLLVSWQEPQPGFLIEHTHRAAGFTVGAIVAVLGLAAWRTEPRRARRWVALLAVVALLGLFGQLHRDLLRQIHAPRIHLPPGVVAGLLGSLGVVLYLGVSGLVGKVPGSAVRLLATASLVGVMIQGLLGGFRVRLNAWAGTDLAAVHGVFAQVVFALLVGLAVLTAAPSAGPAAGAGDRRAARLAWLLVGLVFLQLVWGSAVRHTLSPLAQRGHLLTAFAVVAAGVWLAAESARTSPLWSRLRGPLAFLGVLLALQVALGVEAWLGRFAGQILPELQIVTAPQAVVRTLHFLLGSGILATSVVLSLRLAAPAWVEHPGVAEATPPESRPITALREPQLEGTA